MPSAQHAIKPVPCLWPTSLFSSPLLLPARALPSPASTCLVAPYRRLSHVQGAVVAGGPGAGDILAFGAAGQGKQARNDPCQYLRFRCCTKRATRERFSG